MEKINIKYYKKESGNIPFDVWLEGLDTKVRRMILGRLLRLREGLFGDYKVLSESHGIFELKVALSPGYRIYYGKYRGAIIILCAGSKKTQQKDIETAKRYWGDFKLRKQL